VGEPAKHGAAIFDRLFTEVGDGEDLTAADEGYLA
jgi:hypothetical protein